MNGFHEKSLDEDNFGPANPLSAVKAFDAFPKTKPSYTQKTSNGGVWTVVLLCASLWLASTELSRWWQGDTTHTFSVEQGVGHDLQINLDLVVAMKCTDLHINVQDASGDRILASNALTTDATVWSQWQSKQKQALGQSKEARLEKELGSSGDAREYRREDVHDYLGAARHNKKFKRTPRVRGGKPDSCRLYGSMHLNKVQGDFHITARGHGYSEFGQHLDHSVFNFSHVVNELSFGPFYPSLVNPLDNTIAVTEHHFNKFQYYMSIVPTVYTTDAKALRKLASKQYESPSSGSDGLEAHPYRYSKNTVFTNQYAVTEQSHTVPENNVPGIFVKYDMEPIMLTIAEEWSSMSYLFVRLVNVISGVLVAGGWLYQLTEWSKEVYARRRARHGYEGAVITPVHNPDAAAVAEKQDLYYANGHAVTSPVDGPYYSTMAQSNGTQQRDAYTPVVSQTRDKYTPLHARHEKQKI